MKKGLIAIAVLAVTTIPAVLATVYLFGCCALPFHKVLHELMPVCRIAISAFTDEEPASTPAPSPEESRPRFTTDLPRVFRAPALDAAPFTAPAVLTTRSSLSPAAARCDRDVGLHLLLLATFRI